MATNDMSNEGSGLKSVSTHQDTSPPPSVEVKALKRSSSNEISTSSTSLTKQSCTKSLSSIRAALHDDEKNQQQHGLLRYFTKATEEQHCEYLMTTDEEMKDRLEDILWSSAQAKRKQAEKKRQYEREKKCVQHTRLKNQEIQSGL